MDTVSRTISSQAMLPFSIMSRIWFPAILGTVLAASILSGRVWLLLCAAALLLGFGLQLRQLDLKFVAALERPANVTTLARLLAVLAGLLLIGPESVPIWIPLFLVCGGLALDFLDGILARRFPSGDEERAFGAWMDRESDALALFLIGRMLLHATSTLHPIFIIGTARYLFGIFFLLLPLPVPEDRGFASLSRTIAAMAQFAAGAALFPLLAPELTARTPGAAWLIPLYAWFAAGLVLFSFLWEGLLRVKNFLRAAGADWRGLLRSYLIYYRLPLRYLRMKRFYSGFVGQGDLVFDIGAHLGNRIPPLLALGCRVLAVEPQPGCTDFLSLWFGRRPNVDLLFVAVGDRPGRTPLYLCGEYPTLTSLAPDWIDRAAEDPLFSGIRWREAGSVEVTTLEKLISRYGEPDFVKIDVEGFEEKVVAGAGGALKALSFEFLPAAADNALAVVDRLETAASYRYNLSWGESMRLALGEWISAEELRKLLHDARRGTKSGDIYAIHGRERDEQ